jgi:hypothetical protein
MTIDERGLRYQPGAAGEAHVKHDDGRWTLQFVREFRHAPEKVWLALTDPVHLREWALRCAGRSGTCGAHDPRDGRRRDARDESVCREPARRRVWREVRRELMLAGHRGLRPRDRTRVEHGACGTNGLARDNSHHAGIA